ncbi:MAG: hypothetical protein H7222_07510 [Methylotenera sp.]|nr:hypothetical protein [Oligoflexia bacterium]
MGLLFDPPVTTQFISNVERGVTPLPPIHVPVLTRALSISESELTVLLEQEYTAKLSGRLGHTGSGLDNGFMSPANLKIDPKDMDFMRQLYAAYQKSDPTTQHSFISLCASLLKIAPGVIQE